MFNTIVHPVTISVVQDITNPIYAVSGFTGPPSASDMLVYFKDGVDSIGLSVSDYGNIDPTVQDVFFVDSLTLRPTAEALVLAYASPYLNEGTMIGDEGVGLVLYMTGTDQTVLDSALRFFKQYQYLHYNDTFNYKNLENYI